MAVRGDNSLFFESGINNDGLKKGASEATGIIQNLAGTIAGINPFAALALGAATAFAAVGASAFNMMREFEQAMKEVETISEATQKNFKGISAEVFALSKISPDAPAKLAKAYYQIVSAGYDGAAGMKLLETATKAATAGVTSTETAADGITTVLNAFKLEASEADTVADALFTTVRLGKTNFEQLSTTIAQVAPLAASAGFSFQEVLAAVATLTKQGTPTAQAMTQIRAALQATSKVLGDGAAKSMTLQNAFQAISDKAGGSQNKLTEMVGSVEAVGAVLALTGKNAEGAAKDLEDLGKSAGSADGAFKRMAGSNVNEWAILGNRIKATTEDIGNSIVEVSSGIARVMNDALGESDNFTESIRRQANEFNLLKNSLEASNVPFEEKLEILTTLKNQYPEYLRSLDLDKISNDNLEQTLLNVADALRDINNEQERRLKLSGANQKLIDSEARVQVEKGLYEENISDFYTLVEDAKDYAAKNEIKLNFNPGDDPTRIFRDIQRDLNASPFSEGGRLVANLYQAENAIRVYKKRLGEANSELDRQEQNLEITKRLTYDNADGAKQIVAEIKALDSFEALNTFENYTNPEINKALKERQTIVAQLSSIRAIQDVESLKPFLDSELEEIKKYAQERSRQLNTSGGNGGTPDSDPQAYAKSLKERQSQYEAYQAVVNQIGKDAAQEQFASLMEMGKNFGEFLKNQLSQTTNFARQQAIAVAAESAGINLNRGTAKTVSSLKAPVLLDVKIDQTSIDFIDREIGRLKEKWRAASTEDRAALEGPIKMWEKRLEEAQKGLSKEEKLYDDVNRALSDMTFQSLRDYIKYWKERLILAEGNADLEKEILGKIQDANAIIWQKHITEITQQLTQVSGSLRDLGANDMADLVDGLSSVGGELEGIFKIVKNQASDDEKLMIGINAAIGLADMLISSAGRRKAAETDYYNSVISQQKEYNRLLNEQLLTQEGANENVFTTDYIQQIENGIEALKDANESYQDSLSALSEGQAKIGQRNAVDWNNVLSGAAQGAALGTAILPGIGTAIGAVGGAIAGLFGGKKKKNEFTDLLTEWPELVSVAEDGVRSINTELAQTLIEQNLVNDSTKILLEDTIAWQEQIQEAREQIAGVVESLAGGLGNNLRDSLVDAFQAGEDAAVAMGDTISDTLQDVLAQLLFDQIFSAQFKKLQDEMTASFDGGDGSWTDDFGRFFEASKELTDAFNRELQAAKEAGEDFGFDVFGPEQGAARDGLAGSISNITEDTANILESYMNAMRLDLRQSLTVNTQSMLYLAEITVNTSYLLSIDSNMKSVDGRFANIESAILEFQSRG